jgi:hypothetical protein
MNRSHAAARASATPTPAQLKELFAQIEVGRVTKARLQAFLRDEPLQEEPQITPLPVADYFLRKGFALANKYAQAVMYSDFFGSLGGGLLRNKPDFRHGLVVGRFHREFVARVTLVDTHPGPVVTVILVNGVENVTEFQNIAAELEETWGTKIKVELADKKVYYESN